MQRTSAHKFSDIVWSSERSSSKCGHSFCNYYSKGHRYNNTRSIWHIFRKQLRINTQAHSIVQRLSSSYELILPR